MQWKNLASLAVALLAWTITASSVPARQETVAPRNGNPEANSLALTLATDKQIYRISEPIYFTLNLRNESSNGLWVGNSIVFADLPGTFVMTVTDAQGKPVHGDRVYFAGSLGDFKREDLFDWIRKTRLVLCPGCFLGMAAKLQDYKYDLTVPGKYRL